MKKVKKTKKPAKRNPRASARAREIVRQVKHFVYWRKQYRDEKGEPVTHTFINTLNYGNIDPIDVEFTLNHSDVRYQCLTITYCRDNWGMLYKLFGYSQSLDAVVVAEESVASIIQAARGHAEENGNTKHIIGHAMIMTPIFSDGVKIGDVAVKLRKELELDDKELAQLKECIESEAAIYEVDRVVPSSSLEDELRYYLNQ
jgi:hypothetical protein